MIFSVRHKIADLIRGGLLIEKELAHEDDFGKRESHVIEPGEFVLASTLEHIYMPRNLIAMVEGRSSYARVGLSMHQTAPWIQPGWNGQITLEIRNSGPWKIELLPVDDKPCQLTFMRLAGELAEDKSYGARLSDRFQNQTKVSPN